MLHLSIYLHQEDNRINILYCTVLSFDDLLKVPATYKSKHIVHAVYIHILFKFF